MNGPRGEQTLVPEQPMPCPEPGCSGTLRRQHSRHGWFYGCNLFRDTGCKGAVSCHPDGRAAGVPVDSRTRVMRQVAHQFFDRLWQRWPMTRNDAYALMKEQMGVEGDLHIGNLDEDQCERLIDLVQDQVRFLNASAVASKFEEVEPVRAELEGPFECSICHGHLMVDATFLDQVSLRITCPYCQHLGSVRV